MNPKPILLFFFLFIGIFISYQTKAQTLNQQNFSSMRVDDLSDDQIRDIIKKIDSSGLPESQLENMAAAQGMQPSEIQKLRSRVNALRAKDAAKTNGLHKNNSTGNSDYNRSDPYPFSQKDSTKKTQDTLQTIKSRIFGRELFANSSTSFEPNLKLATPINYVVGPGDQLLIDIYGYSEASYQLTVSPEGTINIPYAGVIQVGGLTIEAATSRIRAKLSPIYSSLSSGNTKLSIAIGNIRSIKVILTGEVTKPGSYTLPSLATAFVALYSSGGPTDNGSFRNIEIIRSGRKIATLDVYDFLLSGDLKNNVLLKDQDIIRVPVYQKRVEIVGEVKRPFIYEMKDGENFNDLLNFAGGFTENAYKARVKVLKNTDTERKIADITADEFDTYIPSSGDKYFVNEILDRFENRVRLYGAVFRPGEYELTPGLTLKNLIQKAEGLKEDAFLNRGYITRLTPDLQTELISFDVKKIMSGAAADIVLKREDVINISSIFDLKEEYHVQINGEVRQPGQFAFSDNMSLEELIIKAGGFKEAATPQRIEVSRRVRNSDATSSSATTAEVFQIDVNKDLSVEAAKFILQPFDIVTVRAAPGYEVQKQVRIDGEVLYPGFYAITKKDERISDLVKRAGGLTALAYTDGASLKRTQEGKTQLEQEQEQQKLLKFEKLQQDVKDTLSLDLQNKAVRNDFVGINLSRILKDPGTKADLFLEDQDVVNIPKQLQTVRVSGEILSPGTVVYRSSKGFKSYISNGGGFSERALKRRAYIIYANGTVKSTGKILFFNNYPPVKPGGEIFVPKKEEKRKLTASEILGLTSGLASIGAIILGIINITK